TAARSGNGAPPATVDHLSRAASDVGWRSSAGLRLPRLIFSREEAEAIPAVVPPGQGTRPLDFEANPVRATSPELANYRVVHIATHALLDAAHPELSGVVLSLVDRDGRPQNGFLELQDVYNLKLPVDMVVLSACQSGLGKEVQGEGVIGL